jgi:hypothetical protein
MTVNIIEQGFASRELFATGNLLKVVIGDDIGNAEFLLDATGNVAVHRRMMGENNIRTILSDPQPQSPRRAPPSQFQLPLRSGKRPVLERGIG